WTAAVRSINGLPAAGGFGAAASSGTALQVEEINPRWLRAGLNGVRFFAAPEGDGPPSRITDLRRPDRLREADADPLALPYTVRNLRLVFLEGPPDARPTLRLTYPTKCESDADGTAVRGYVDPAALPSGPAELFVDDAYVPN